MIHLFFCVYTLYERVLKTKALNIILRRKMYIKSIKDPMRNHFYTRKSVFILRDVLYVHLS